MGSYECAFLRVEWMLTASISVGQIAGRARSPLLEEGAMRNGKPWNTTSHVHTHTTTSSAQHIWIKIS